MANSTEKSSWSRPAWRGLRGANGSHVATPHDTFVKLEDRVANKPEWRSPPRGRNGAPAPSLGAVTPVPGVGGAKNAPRSPSGDAEPSALTASQRDYVEEFQRGFLEKTRASREVAARSGAVLCDSRRAFVARHGMLGNLHYPICATSSSGAHFRAAGGRDYLDLAMGFGCHLFGHNPPFLIEALTAQLDKSLAEHVESEHEAEVRRMFGELTGLTLLEFRSSGTEAIMAAIRVARATTGRTKVAVLANAYHGHFDSTLVTASPGSAQFAASPMASGVPASLFADTLVLPFGDAVALEMVARHAHELAAVFVEPVQNRKPDFHPGKFLAELRSVTAEHGVLLVFDEVLLGFRVHPAGAQGWFGVRADLAAYGKILGGGTPIASLAASPELAATLRHQAVATERVRGAEPSGSGAFAMAAARAMLTELTRSGPALQRELNARTDRLLADLNQDFKDLGVPLGARNFGSFFRFCQGGNFSFIHTPAEFELFLKELVAEGVYVIEGATCFLSTAHDDEDLEHLRSAARRATERMLGVGFWSKQRKVGGAPSRARSDAPADARPAPTAMRAVAPAAQTQPREVPHTARAGAHGLDIGISFFGSYERTRGPEAFAGLLDMAREADAMGLSALWLPERHFHAFGGFSPNPSVLAAAVAVQTRNIAIRAGSVILPLHHPARVVEEWAVVDNLSHGRVGLTFASGWQANDFVFAPGGFAGRKAGLFTAIETVQRLWRGEPLKHRNDLGDDVELRTYPQPVQATVPTWVASLGDVETFERAGALGVGILTNLIGQDVPTLSEKIALYRRARERHGHDPAQGHVAVLVHTFIGEDLSTTREAARKPLYEYLMSAVDLRGRMFGDTKADFSRLTDDDRDYILSKAFDRYTSRNALIGTPESCAPILRELRAAGADEVACFVDFGIAPELVRSSLPHLAALLSGPPASGVSTRPARAREIAAEPAIAATSPSVQQSRGVGEEAPGAGRPKTRIAPASADQAQLFLQNRLGGHRARAYHVRTLLRLRGPLRLAAFQGAWQALNVRHEVLRTVLLDEGRAQRVLGRSSPPPTVIDLSRLAAGEREPALSELLAQEWSLPFDLEAQPAYRVTLACLDEREHVMVLSVHHALLDASGTNTLLEELGTLYRAGLESRESGLPSALQFIDFLEERRGRLAPQQLAEHERFFRTLFPDGIPRLDLPTDFPRPALRSYRGRQYVGHVPESLFARLKRASRRAACTPFLTVLASYALLLQRWSRQADVVIGTSARPSWTAGRGLAGWSTNLLPILVQGSESTTVEQLLRHVRARFLDALDHEDVPFATLLEWFGAGDPGSLPLIATTFNWDKVAVPELPELEVEVLATASIDSTRFDLALDVNELPEGLSFYWDFNTDLFRAESVECLHSSLLTLLDGLVAAVESAPQGAVGALPSTTLDPLPVSPLVRQPEPTLLMRFLAHVDDQPDEPAVADENGELSYREVSRRMRSVAGQLGKAGVATGDRVLVHLPAGADLLVILLACWSRGAVVVPLDVNQPEPWKRAQSALIGARVVFTSPQALLDLPDVVPLSANFEEAVLEDVGLAAPSADLPAYIVFTSGSTGQPKAVVINHANVAHYSRAVCERLGLARGTYLCVSPPQVDLGYTMWFAALFTGGKLCLASSRTVEQVSALFELASTHPPDYLKITPSHFEALAAHDGIEKLLPAEKLIFGGETLRWELIDKLSALPHRCSVANHYGPAETTVGVAAGEVPRERIASTRSVPVGAALGETVLLVLDAALQPLPDGLAGELCVAGPSVGAGYFSDTERTEQAFITVQAGQLASLRLYRTGDWARRLPDGSFEILGRIDRQLKVHGFRFEPAMLENLLAEHPAVERAVVTSRADAGGNLVAYYTTRAGFSEPSVDDLRELVRGRVPRPLVPAFFVRIAALPLSPGGKLNLAALPPAEPIAVHKSAAPAGAAEQTMLSLWREVLGRPEMGVDDDFFEVGGHSLHAIRLSARVKRAFGVDVGLDVLFEQSTVAQLVRSLNLNAAVAVGSA